MLAWSSRRELPSWGAGLLDAAWDRVRSWSPEERDSLNLNVARHGFSTPFQDGTVRDLCLWMLDLSRQGLTRRSYKNQQGDDESLYLNALQEAAEAGTTFADQIVRRFEHDWRGDIDTAIRALCQETLS